MDVILLKVIEIFADIRTMAIVDNKNNLMKRRYYSVDKDINNKHKNAANEYSEHDDKPRYTIEEDDATAKIRQKCYRNEPYDYTIKKWSHVIGIGLFDGVKIPEDPYRYKHTSTEHTIEHCFVQIENGYMELCKWYKIRVTTRKIC